MKNIVKILLFSWVCMATKCQEKENENCHPAISFSNNTTNSLRVRERFHHSTIPSPFTNPLDIKDLSYTAIGEKYKVNDSEQGNRRAISSSDCFEKLFNREGYSGTVYVYVFDSEVVENTPWEVVARDYLVLKRYDLTLEDLQRLDWKITYPPTEAMKDVKQYPPYGSE